MLDHNYQEAFAQINATVGDIGDNTKRLIVPYDT